jgi:DNA-directed RNA polymerase specialized sigma24 family protein
MTIDPAMWTLLQVVAERGAPGWQPLLERLEPELALMARRQPIGRLRDREDTPREIVTRTIARLHAKEFAAIKKLVALDPRPELQAWLRVLVKRSAIDYMRESPEYERATAKREHRWISLATLSSSQGPTAMPDSLAEKRDQVTAFVRTAAARALAEQKTHGEDAIARLALEWKIGRIHVRRLIARADQYVTVLGAVLAGFSYPEVADKLGLSRREVELTVRYLEELLQARGFAGPVPEEPDSDA